MKPTRRQINIMAKSITPAMYHCGIDKALVLPYLSSEVVYFVACPHPYMRLIYGPQGVFIEAVELDPETNYETH